MNNIDDMGIKKQKRAKHTTYGFGVSETDKLWIQTEVEKLKELANQSSSLEYKLIKKNQLTLEALKIGIGRLNYRLKNTK